MARQLDVTDALEARSRQIMWVEREIKLKGTAEDGGGTLDHLRNGDRVLGFE